MAVAEGKAMNFMDALILDVAEEHNCSKFVTWVMKR
jgi:predicted nucleic acid-binding protein